LLRTADVINIHEILGLFVLIVDIHTIVDSGKYVKFTPKYIILVSSSEGRYRGRRHEGDLGNPRKEEWEGQENRGPIQACSKVHRPLHILFVSERAADSDKEPS
jgi:hypothetical protein